MNKKPLFPLNPNVSVARQQEMLRSLTRSQLDMLQRSPVRVLSPVKLHKSPVKLRKSPVKRRKSPAKRRSRSKSASKRRKSASKRRKPQVGSAKWRLLRL